MAGPAIPHDELFGFSEYQKAIELAKASTIELASILNKFASNTKIVLTETLSQVSAKAKEIIPEKEITKLQALDKELTNLGYSAEQSRAVIAGLTKVNQSAGDSIAAMEAKARELAKQYKSLSEEERNNVEVGGVIIKNLAEMKVATSQYNEIVKTTTKTLTTAENSYSALSSELTRMKAELKAMPNAFSSVTGEINKENKAAVELSQKIGIADNALKKMDAGMGQFTRNVGNYESGTVSLREQIKQLTATLAQMELEGKRGTEAYNILLQKAGELKDAMLDTSAAIKRVGSDTSTIEGLAGVFEGVAGAAAVAEGATALFGEQNEAVAETIKRLQSVQAMLMGVQAVANMLQKESAAVLLVVNLQRKLEALNTNLQTAAESKNIIVRKSAIVAQKLLNAAMKANPVGILIVAVTALAGAILWLTKRTDSAKESQKKLNEVQKAQIELHKELWSLYDESYNKSVSNAQKEIDLAKAKGASQLELFRLEQNLLAVKSKYATAIYNQNAVELAQLDLYEESYKSQLKILNDLEKKKINKERFDFRAIYPDGEVRKVKDDDIEIQRSRVENIKSSLDFYKKIQNDFDAIDKEVKINGAERNKFLADQDIKSKIANYEAQIILAKEGSKKELDLKINLVNAKREADLKNENLTQGERIKINAEADKSIRNLRKEFNLKLKNDTIEAETALINAKLLLVEKGSDNEYKLKEDLILKQYELDKANLDAEVMNEELKAAKLKELYNKQLADKKELEKEKRLAELERVNDKSSGSERLEIIKNQQVIANTRSTFKEINVARLANEGLAQQAIDRELALNQQKYDELLISHDDYEKRKTELTIEQEQLRLQKIQETAQAEAEIKQATMELLTGINSAYNEIVNNQVEQRISQLDKEKEMAIKAAGENTDAKSRIEANYNKKVREEKKKAAKAEKATALFSAIINTAAAVVKALNNPWPLNIILAALTAALGGVQIAAIASKPIPQYRKGTQNAPEGLAIVNDELGPVYQEIIERQGKSYIPSRRNQLVYLKKGDKVIKAAETRGILANAKKAIEIERMMQEQSLQDAMSVKLESGRKLEIMHNLSGAMLSNRLNEKAIGDEVGKHIANIPQQINIWDERGHRRGLRRGSTTIVYLNDRNSL